MEEEQEGKEYEPDWKKEEEKQSVEEKERDHRPLIPGEGSGVVGKENCLAYGEDKEEKDGEEKGRWYAEL